MTEPEIDPSSSLSKSHDPHKLPWYEPELSEVQPKAREILENYSNIPPDEVVQHVNKLRDRAFAIFPYPCVGGFRFLDMTISELPIYPEILERLKSGGKLLDVGCALGQVLRRLVFDGVPSSNLYATDLRADFYEAGFDLFNDRSTLKAQFIEADIFDANSALAQQLTGKMDIVNANSFFHLFTWDQQVTAVKQIIALLRPRPGSLVVGRQVGRKNPIDPDDEENASKRYCHDVETWKRLWRQVESETGSRWEVEAWMEVWVGVEGAFAKYRPDVESFKMRFVSRRL